MILQTFINLNNNFTGSTIYIESIDRKFILQCGIVHHIVL